MSTPEKAIARVIAKLQKILDWWAQEQDRHSSGTALAGEIEGLIKQLKRDYPGASNS